MYLLEPGRNNSCACEVKLKMKKTTQTPLPGADGASAADSSQPASARQNGKALRHFAQAVTLHLRSDREGALAELDATEENGGDATQVNAARGHIQFELKRFEDAACSYSRLCEIDPQNSETRFLLGLCYHNLGHHAEALEAFRTVLKKNPAHLQAQLAAGTCLLNLNKHKEALEAFTSAQSLAPDSEAALFGQAVALQMGWSFEDAAALPWRGR